MSKPVLVAALLCASMSGCNNSSSKPKPDVQDRPPPANAQPAAPGLGAPDSPAGAAGQPLGAPPAAQPVGATPPAAAPAANPNTPPTLAEWDAQTKEVTVRGSSALSCETKMVRSWLRVSCRGKNDTGGTPQSLTITKGGGDGKTFTFATPGVVTSLVLPFVMGVDVEAAFRWSDKSMKLHVWWPRGAPEPPPKGVFSPM